MLDTDPLRTSLKALVPALGLMLAATSVQAAAPGASSSVQARLVHCGAQTCLRVSGHRAGSAVAIRIAGHDVPVEGGRNWRVTVPAQAARGWVSASGAVLPIAYVDARSKSERRGEVMLPPGALGRRVELATLLVSAH